MITKCPVCGKEISYKARNCPECGCPINRRNNKVYIFIAIIIAIGIIFTIFNISKVVKNNMAYKESIFNDIVNSEYNYNLDRIISENSSSVEVEEYGENYKRIYNMDLGDGLQPVESVFLSLKCDSEEINKLNYLELDFKYAYKDRIIKCLDNSFKRDDYLTEDMDSFVEELECGDAIGWKSGSTRIYANFNNNGEHSYINVYLCIGPDAEEEMFSA